MSLFGGRGDSFRRMLYQPQKRNMGSGFGFGRRYMGRGSKCPIGFIKVESQVSLIAIAIEFEGKYHRHRRIGNGQHYCKRQSSVTKERGRKAVFRRTSKSNSKGAWRASEEARRPSEEAGSSLERAGKALEAAGRAAEGTGKAA